MVKLDLITKKDDECYTPPYAIVPLLKYIPKESTVWCPFDTEESHFVKLLRQHGCTVILSHIQTGKDFFNYTPTEHVDFIISNPPYSLKTKVLMRCFELKIPFALLVGVVGLFESQQRFDMFRTNNFEVMYFNRRVAFFKDFKDQKPLLNPPFSSVFICHSILPKQIVFEEINKCWADNLGAI